MEVERTPGQSIPGCFRKGTNYPLPVFPSTGATTGRFCNELFPLSAPAEDGNCQVSREYAYFSALRGLSRSAPRDRVIHYHSRGGRRGTEN